MKVFTIILLNAAVLCAVSNSLRAQVWEEWVASWNWQGNSCEMGSDIALDSEGNIYVAGETEGAFSDDDIVTIKYSPEGDELWVRVLEGYGRYNLGIGIVVDQYNCAYVLGSLGPSPRDYIVIKYDSSGVEQWIQIYDGPINGDDKPAAIGIDPDGFIYVTGASIGNSTQYDYYTIKYDSEGNEVWAHRYNELPDSSSDKATGLDIDQSGNVYVTGTSTDRELNNDIVTVKYNSAGDILWTERYSYTRESGDEALFISLDDPEAVYIGGRCRSILLDDIMIVKYDSAGVLQWDYFFPCPGGAEFLEGIAVDNDGNVCATGYTGWIYCDWLTFKCDADGALLWSQTYSSGTYFGDRSKALVFDESGAIYVTGWSSSDWLTKKFAGDGDELFSIIYDGPCSLTDHAQDLITDDQGNIFVTGYSRQTLGGNDDLTVIKYTQTAPPPAPQIGVSTDTLDFGETIVSQQTTLPLTIQNWGDATLVIY